MFKDWVAFSGLRKYNYNKMFLSSMLDDSIQPWFLIIYLSINNITSKIVDDEMHWSLKLDLKLLIPKAHFITNCSAMPILSFGRKTSRYRSRVNRPEKCQQPISVLSLGLHSESSVGIDRLWPSAGRIWPNHRLPVRPPVDLYRVARWY